MKHELALVLASTLLTTALSAVDAEKGSTRPTPTPTVMNEFEKMSIADMGYPVGEVIGHRTVYALNDSQAKSATHEVDIVWTQVGDDEATITTDLERLVRGTRDVLWPPSGPISLVALASAPVIVVSEEYTALMPSTNHPFVKGAATRVQITTESL